MRKIAGILALILAVVAPATVLAQSSVEKQIADMIRGNFEYSLKNMRDKAGTNSKDGSLEFWSSGGLLQQVPAQPPITHYDSFNLNPKHIRVVQVADDVAVALYYSEGSFKMKDSAEVPHYMTRVLEVYVKEGDGWKVRAAHWSPVAGGSGTAQTAPLTD